MTLEDVFSDAEVINCDVPQGSVSESLFFLIYIYINVLRQALNKNGSYLYDDDTCIFNQVKDVEKIEKSLIQKSFVTKWMDYRK